jgi:Flp pilus assembly protein TadD
MADAQSRAGQVEHALATISRAIEKDPSDPLVRSIARRLQAR